MAVLRGRQKWALDPGLVQLEEAVRARAARRVRGHVRRMEPVALLTPRWSSPQTFLEDLALDLAVGQPGVQCRTVSFRPLRKRSAAEAWNFVLRVLGDLTGGDAAARPLPMVCDRRGFLFAAGQMLEIAHEEAPAPIALLAHGTDNLPVEVIADLTEVWNRYLSSAGERRCTVLFAGGIEHAGLDIEEAIHLDLCDFAPIEATAALAGRVGSPPDQSLDTAIRFSGGVPAILSALAEGAVARGVVPTAPAELLRCLGPVADELRAAVEMALTAADSAERLHVLLDGDSHLEDPEVDRALLMSGVIRRVRGPGSPRVALRSPALAAVV
jgi:hypothetical protein